MGSYLNFISPSRLRGYIKANKRQYLIVAVLIIVGMILGVYLNLGGFIDDIVFTATDLNLAEIIVGEVKGFTLFFKNLWALVLPACLIFLMFTNKYTKFLSYVYMAYQGLLLGASITTIISEGGIAGVLNSLIIILPINLMNLFVLMSVLVVSERCQSLRRSNHLKFSYSIKIFFTKFMVCLMGALFSSFVYGFIYPLLLKTVVVVSA